MSDPYARLAALAERERDLVEAGRLDELEELHRLRERLVAELPDAPPTHARHALERAAKVQTATSALLDHAIGELRAELRRLDTGRRTVRGYAPALETARAVDHAG